MENDNDNGSEPYKLEVRKGPPVAPVQFQPGDDTGAQEIVQPEPAHTTTTPEHYRPTDAIYDIKAPTRTNSVLDQGPLVPEQSSPEPPGPPKRPYRMSWRRTAGVTLVAVGLLTGVVLVLHNVNTGRRQAALNANLTDQSERIKTQNVALPGLGQQLHATAQTANTLTVNGSLVLAPSSKPNQAVDGELYYNQGLNQMQYYDGTSFVSLQGGGSTTNITNNSFGSPVTDNITNVTNVNGGGGNVTASSGTAGELAMFTGNNSLGSSVLDENGSTLTTTGALHLLGSDSTTALQVTNTSGATLLNVDTAGNVLTLGTGAGSSFGNTSTGPNATGDLGAGIMNGFKYTTNGAGTLESLSININIDQDPAPNNKFQMAIYSDNSGSPGSYLGSTNVGTLLGNGWFSLSLTAPLNLAANTAYWIVYWENGPTNTMAYKWGGFPNVYSFESTNPITWQSGSDNGMPATLPAGNTHTGNLYSIYGTFSSSGSALTINSAGLLTQNGASNFQDPTDSVTAFQIQDSLGNPLFVADTGDMIIQIGGSLNVTGSITVDGHIVTGGGTPGIAAGAAACTSPTISINGTDTSGAIDVTTGTGCASGGTLATITFASAFSAMPHVTLTPGSSNAAGLNAFFNSSTISTSGFTLGVGNTPASTTTYVWDYWAAQ